MSNNTEHFEHYDPEANKMGMWLFLFTELFLFGGLFLVYAVFRAKYPHMFHHAAMELNTFLGTLNTAILLISSMTAAMSITAVQKQEIKRAMALVGVTLFMAALFMVNKYFEWSYKFEHHLYPGSDVMKSMEHGEILFYSLYFLMTGLHGLHVLIGMVLLIICMVQIKKGKIHAGRIDLLENSGLYWHLVDLIWIFLFPLLYLLT